MENSWITFAIGFGAQMLFGARMLTQWILSERQREVISPKIFWELSLLGAVCFFIYGWMRNDVSILVGQLITYGVYIRNLQLKDVWKKIWLPLRLCLFLLPIAALTYIIMEPFDWKTRFINNLPTWLIILGIAGQVLFTLRFLVQYYLSEKAKESILPPQFWIISLAGSALILIYAVYRQDPVLLVGHLLGAVVYIRNLMIGYKSGHVVKKS
jgi:lipid-A-disaccharide synthase-like uncharacterized protein